MRGKQIPIEHLIDGNGNGNGNGNDSNDGNETVQQPSHDISALVHSGHEEW